MRTTVAHEWQSSANAGAGYWTVIIAETQCSSATVRLYLTLHGQRAGQIATSGGAAEENRPFSRAGRERRLRLALS
jgi:hypothetical protein